MPSDSRRGSLLQAFFDYVNYKCLCKFAESGNAELSWKDMHKWSMLDLCFQACPCVHAA